MNERKARQLEQKLYEYIKDNTTGGRKNSSVIKAMEKVLNDNELKKDDNTKDENNWCI